MTRLVALDVHEEVAAACLNIRFLSASSHSTSHSFIASPPPLPKSIMAATTRGKPPLRRGQSPQSGQETPQSRARNTPQELLQTARPDPAQLPKTRLAACVLVTRGRPRSGPEKTATRMGPAKTARRMDHQAPRSLGTRLNRETDPSPALSKTTRALSMPFQLNSCMRSSPTLSWIMTPILQSRSVARTTL